MSIPVCVIDRRKFWRDCLTQCLTLSEANIAAEGFDSIEDWFDVSESDSSTIVLLCANGGAATNLLIGEKIIAIHEARPDTKIVIVSDVDSAEMMVHALEKGARGFVTLSLSLEVAIEAIRIVNVGGIFIPASGLLSTRRADMDEEALPASQPGRHAHFTERQLAIIACVRKGEPNKIIAHKLNMTESTVKVHIRNIMRKIKAKNRTEVAFLTNELPLPTEMPHRN